MRVLIQHRSSYRYPSPALLGPQRVRLRPCDHARARIESYKLAISPEHRIHWQRDPQNNHVARVGFKLGQTTELLELVVELAVDIRPINPFDFFVDLVGKTVPFTYPAELANELAPCLELTDPAYRIGRRFNELLRTLPYSGDSVALLVELNATINRKLQYVIRDEPGVWTPEETLTNGRGSCRDLSVLLVAILRSRGIAARFVSGYLVQLTDEGMIPNAPKGVSRDVVDLHAWVEAFLPGAGWIGLDATSGLMCGEGHIPLAATASPGAAAPLEGTSDVGAAEVSFATTIARLAHEIRPTAPYPEPVWEALLAAGDRADATLADEELVVWSGGEPTYLARDGQAAEEWQGGALGPGKWKHGRELAATLRDRLAPGGAVMYRMGKHYPGESLPRWALDIVGRRDGAPLWTPRVLADDASQARPLAAAIAKALGIAAELHPAYEDPSALVRTEAALPVDGGKLDTEDRKRLARVLDQGAAEVVGWVLPIARGVDGGWRTQAWSLRRERLFLVPGESPIGLRLPLASLAGELPPVWLDAPDLPDPRMDEDADERQPMHPWFTGAIKTAITVEPRDGQLWVFLPPLPRASDFCALLAAIDVARAEVGVEAHLEGYPPPPSRELAKFAVTPDPGVLEVNLAPQTSTRAAAALHAIVFDTALATGLTSERYMLDGRAAGSGGGNHITIGGPSAAESPWFRRPDLLASLLAFTQHHPSLSYLFTGAFVGPTSQAPRIDEARHDSLYELELALPRLFAEPVPPAWQVDGLLRHLLVDIAGSTHRAEISIDKLFDPGTPFGRQGIVEFRAFEMPPHPRMAAAQVVFVRTLLAALATHPYRHPLVRWGSELHDRFLLPYYLWRDFEDVLAHLARCDQPLDPEGFRPFVELRCPLVGTIDVGDGRVEVRNAIEPWPVLGEEVTQAGTARYVDSSVERIELRAIDVPSPRFAVCVNGWQVPLRSTAQRDTRVGGVRFRAWCPPHSLQPHLGIHHPLHIDVVDTWASRGVGAGTYHVWHPEGRGFDVAPLTGVEAAARRAQRFTLGGGEPSPVVPRPVAAHPEQAYTLDLRRVDPGVPMPRVEDWPEGDR